MLRFLNIFKKGIKIKANNFNDTNNNNNIEQINETSAYLLHSEQSDYTISRDQLLILLNIIKVQTLRILAMYVLSLLRLPNFLMSVANSVKFQLISRIIWQGINISYKLQTCHQYAYGWHSFNASYKNDFKIVLSEQQENDLLQKMLFKLSMSTYWCLVSCQKRL